MTNEQEAIEIVYKYLNFNEICGTRNFKDALEIVLSMLKEKDKEIEKKDKQIDLMAQFIATLDIEEDICANVENNNCDKMALGECENCIKQYFAGLVEKE